MTEEAVTKSDFLILTLDSGGEGVHIYIPYIGIYCIAGQAALGGDKMFKRRPS